MLKRAESCGLIQDIAAGFWLLPNGIVWQAHMLLDAE